MNKNIAELIDNYALYKLHMEKSKKTHFKRNDNVLLERDIKYFYTTPAVPEVKFTLEKKSENYRIGSYEYKSSISIYGDQNDFSIGTYYQNVSEASSEKTSVIFVHGWRMKNFEKIDKLFLKAFMKERYNMYYFTLPFHFSRNPKDSLYNGEYMISSDIDRTLKSVQQAISDLRALISWIKSKDNSKIILIGVSLGGFIANLATTIEQRIDGLISVFYANSIAYSVWHTEVGKYIKKDLLEVDYDYCKLKKDWGIIDPSIFKPRLNKERILLISGKYDQYVLSDDTDKLWEAWGKPRRIVYSCGHSGIVLCRKQICRDVVEFIKSII